MVASLFPSDSWGRVLHSSLQYRFYPYYYLRRFPTTQKQMIRTSRQYSKTCKNEFFKKKTTPQLTCAKHQGMQRQVLSIQLMGNIQLFTETRSATNANILWGILKAKKHYFKNKNTFEIAGCGLTLTVTIFRCCAFRIVFISLREVMGKPSFSFSIFRRFRATISSAKETELPAADLPSHS